MDSNKEPKHLHYQQALRVIIINDAKTVEEIINIQRWTKIIIALSKQNSNLTTITSSFDKKETNQINKLFNLIKSN